MRFNSILCRSKTQRTNTPWRLEMPIRKCETHKIHIPTPLNPLLIILQTKQEEKKHNDNKFILSIIRCIDIHKPCGYTVSYLAVHYLIQFKPLFHRNPFQLCAGAVSLNLSSARSTPYPLLNFALFSELCIQIVFSLCSFPWKFYRMPFVECGEREEKLSSVCNQNHFFKPTVWIRWRPREKSDGVPMEMHARIQLFLLLPLNKMPRWNAI